MVLYISIKKIVSSQRKHVSLFLPIFSFFPLFFDTHTHVLSIFSSVCFFLFLFPPLLRYTHTRSEHLLFQTRTHLSSYTKHIPLPRQLRWGYFGHAVRLSAADPCAPVRAQGPATAHELSSCDARPPHAQRHRPLRSRPYLISFRLERMESEYIVSEPYGFSLVLRFYCFRARAPMITNL